MSSEEKKTKSSSSLFRIIIAVLVIIIAFSILSGFLQKIKKERQEYKKNISYNNANRNTDFTEQKQRAKQQNSQGIGDIDIPDLFGTRIPRVDENLNEKKNIKKDTNENVNINNEEKNTKEKTNKDLNINNLTTSEDLKNINRDAKNNLNKYLEKSKGNIKKAKTLYILNLLRIILVPVFICMICISYIYERISNKSREEKYKKSRLRERIIIAILIATISIIPFIYALFV